AVEEEESKDLRDYMRVIRRRKAVIALSVVVCVAASLVASFLQTPVYRADAEVLLQPRIGDSLFDTSTGQRSGTDAARNVSTEIQVLRSQPVAQAVQQKLGTAPAVSVAGVGQTDVIKISSESTVPSAAAGIAN